jgi:glycosyltransferase involved in cell wall biosynthesis
MKLLFVHHKLGEFGGAEANIQLTAAELERRGHSSALLYCRGTGRDEGTWRKPFHDSFLLPAMGQSEAAQAVLERFQPDAIYLHNLENLDVLEALLRAPVPVVRMVHDHSLYCMRSYKYNYFTRHICTRPASWRCVFPCLASIARGEPGGRPLRWVSYARKRREIRLNQQCACHIVYSQYLKDELVRNGFDPARIQIFVPLRVPGDDETESNFSDRNIILFAGQLIRGKGVDALLLALAQVRVPFTAIILGDGNQRAACERLSARLGLTDRVQFRGYVPHAELRQYYREATVFAFSSLWPEPFGMAGPEAMCHGIPVVAFDAGGVREWLHDGYNGYLAPWNDTATFAARLEELLTNKARARQLGRQALDWVQRYDAPRQVAMLESIFLNLRQQTSNQPRLPFAGALIA